MRGTDKGIPKLQLRGVNAVVRRVYSPHLELVKGKGYFYFVYDDVENKVYDTHTVMVYTLNQLPLESWNYEAGEFLKKLGVAPNVPK